MDLSNVSAARAVHCPAVFLGKRQTRSAIRGARDPKTTSSSERQENGKPLKRFPCSRAPLTGLKPGENERKQVTTASEASGATDPFRRTNLHKTVAHVSPG